MNVNNKIAFAPVTEEHKDSEEISRKSLTYFQDAWRRLKSNKLSMLGLIGVVSILIFAIIGPFFLSLSYSDQNLDFSNTPPWLSLYTLASNYHVFLTRDYKLLRVDRSGRILYRIEISEKDIPAKKFTYVDKQNEIVMDFSCRERKKDNSLCFTLSMNNESVISQKSFLALNRSFPFGTDTLGRSLLVRVMYGARISLTVAFVAAIVNMLIGVLYGSFSGYEGGRIDNFMMRFVDILNSIPLVIYIIVIMMLIGNRGLWAMIVSLGSVYWVQMARLVRGQVLGLKEQEFVWAARGMGASRMHIILRHLIPNAIGPILVSMTMMIPRAVFTEAFIGFIGLGVSATMASWGTLANDALSALLSYPYQLFFPSLAIAFTMLSFNFLGDGLRDALDPRLRKA